MFVLLLLLFELYFILRWTRPEKIWWEQLRNSNDFFSNEIRSCHLLTFTLTIFVHQRTECSFVSSSSSSFSRPIFHFIAHNTFLLKKKTKSIALRGWPCTLIMIMIMMMIKSPALSCWGKADKEMNRESRINKWKYENSLVLKSMGKIRTWTSSLSLREKNPFLAKTSRHWDSNSLLQTRELDWWKPNQAWDVRFKSANHSLSWN